MADKASQSPPVARARESGPGTPASRREAQEGRGEADSGHVRHSDGSYTRADGETRVGLQLKMRPDDKRALKTQAARQGLSPADYVSLLVQADAG